MEEELQRLRQQIVQTQRDAHRQAYAVRRPEGSDLPKKFGRRTGHAAHPRPTPTPDQIDRVIHVPLSERPYDLEALDALDSVTQRQPC
jgi:hypothetical protein